MKSEKKEVIIKHCPFCGNYPIVRKAKIDEVPEWAGTEIERWVVVECSNEYCLMHPKICFPDKHFAINEWNTRRRKRKIEVEE